MKYRKAVKEVGAITLGSAIIAAAVYFFMLPSNISIGSVAALAMMLNNFIPVPVSVITLVLNLVLLLIGFLLIGAEFGAKTAYTSVVMPSIMGLYEIVFPGLGSLTQDPLLDMVCCILLLGVGLAILFTSNASSGGMDVVAKLIHKYMKVELGAAITISGMMAALTSAICSDGKTVILSILGTYFEGVLVDQFIMGINRKYQVGIISDRVESIADHLLYELHSGASLYRLTGAYSRTDRTELMAVVDKNEYRKLMDYIRTVDPKAFVRVSYVSELMYQPKQRAARTEPAAYEPVGAKN